MRKKGKSSARGSGRGKRQVMAAVEVTARQASAVPSDVIFSHLPFISPTIPLASDAFRKREGDLTFDDSADEVFSEVVKIVHVVDDDVAVRVRHCPSSSRPRTDYAEKYLHEGTE